MAKTEVNSILRALKSELERQETLAAIEHVCKNIANGATTKNNAYPVDKYNEKFHQELITAIGVLEESMIEQQSVSFPLGTNPVLFELSKPYNGMLVRHLVWVKEHLEKELSIQNELEEYREGSGRINATMKVEIEYDERLQDYLCDSIRLLNNILPNT